MTAGRERAESRRAGESHDEYLARLAEAYEESRERDAGVEPVVAASRVVPVRMPASLADSLAAEAAEAGVTTSALVRSLVFEHVAVRAGEISVEALASRVRDDVERLVGAVAQERRGSAA